VRDWPARPCSCRCLSTISGRVRATARTRPFRTTRTPRSGQAGGGTWWAATSSSAHFASLEALPVRRRFIITTICRHHSAEGVWSLKDVTAGKARVAAGGKAMGESRRSGRAERGRRWERGTRAAVWVSRTGCVMGFGEVGAAARRPGLARPPARPELHTLRWRCFVTRSESDRDA